MFGSLGIWEILVILLLAALIFGGKKLPQLGKGLGEAITNFKNSLKKDKDQDQTKEPNKELNNEKGN